MAQGSQFLPRLHAKERFFASKCPISDDLRSNIVLLRANAAGTGSPVPLSHFPRPQGVTSAHLGAGVAAEVFFSEVAAAYVRVDLGGGDSGVSEQLLN